jgi:hypothetical protein
MFDLIKRFLASAGSPSGSQSESYYRSLVLAAAEQNGSVTIRSTDEAKDLAHRVVLNLTVDVNGARVRDVLVLGAVIVHGSSKVRAFTSPEGDVNISANGSNSDISTTGFGTWRAAAKHCKLA